MGSSIFTRILASLIFISVSTFEDFCYLADIYYIFFIAFWNKSLYEQKFKLNNMKVPTYGAEYS